MRPFARRRPPFDTYSPGRKDARVGEARAFLSTARHLGNLTDHGLACQFNLKDGTAAQLLEVESRKREAAEQAGGPS